MIASCERRVAEHGLRSNLYCQWAQELDISRRYGLIIIPERSFGHIMELEGVSAALSRLMDHLAPGGSLVLDLESPPESYEDSENWHGNWRALEDGSTILTQYRNKHSEDGTELHVIGKFELFVDNQLRQTELSRYSERFWVASDFVDVLRSVGFFEIAATNAYDGMAPKPHGTTVYSSKATLG